MLNFFSQKNHFRIHFNDGPFVENLHNHRKYQIVFRQGSEIEHQATIAHSEWAKAFRRYYTPWRIECYSTRGKLVHQHEFYIGNNRVRINIDSKSLGDTLAWIPQIAAFSELHPRASIFVSHFWPGLINLDNYPQLHFIDPEQVLENCYATFDLGFYFKDTEYHHPLDPRTQPLGKVAADILGVKYLETRPRLIVGPASSPAQNPYVCIATASTAKCKHWLYEGGWQKVVDYLNEKGFKVVVIQKESTDLKGIVDKTGDLDITERIADLANCQFMIGLGSGLSWLAWALAKPVILISGFSKPHAEFEKDCLRVSNQTVCNGCWNNPDFEFDRDDWDWCPLHKDTPRQFECSRQISVDSVKQAIDNMLHRNESA